MTTRATRSQLGRCVGVIASSMLAIACGSGGGAGGSGDGGGRDGTLADGGAHHDSGGRRLTNDSGGAGDGGKSCAEGQACGDGGICAGGSCCPSSLACGSTCCGDGHVCSFNTCVKPGASCFDSTGCEAGQYCQYSTATGTDAGPLDAATADGSSCVTGALPRGVCLPAPPTCASDGGAPDGASCIESCQYHPDAGAFAPVLKYSWGGLAIDAGNPNDVMMAPIVLPLEDTNCDGKINGDDVPDIVFTTFVRGGYETDGTLHAIAVRNGALVDRWSVPSPITVGGAAYMINPADQLAGADLDGVPGAEIVACLVSTTGGVTTYGAAAFHPDGTPYWSVAGPVCLMPSIADLNQDGLPEVITEGGILDGQTGALTPFTDGSGTTISNIGYFVVSDIDGDGVLDIVTAGAAYHAGGARFVDTGVGGSYVAIGDLDGDGKPEVIGTGPHSISIWHYDGSPSATANFDWVQQHLDINASGATPACAGVGGGPPTVADFNGDGTPDVALAGSINYAIFDGKKLISIDAGANGTDGGNDSEFFLWTYFPTDDCSSAETGSTIFDFTGDGKPEALYSDQQKLRIFNGPDGGVLFETCNTTGTLVEYPLVVDVDNDGHADIVVVSNAYGIGDPSIACQDYDGGPMGESGIRVFSDSKLSWVRTRAIWNEHPYHITNVNDDGTIPKKELPNWTQTGLNNFRQNKQPGYEFAAPDAVISVRPSCSDPFTLTATVLNIGEAALPAGVLVDFYGGSPATKLGSAVTSVALYSAQSVTVVLKGASSTKGPFYAVVDPATAPAHPQWHECRTDNNTSATVSITSACGSGPK